MLDDYLYEIIGVVVLLVLLAIYSINKNKTPQTSKEQEELLADIHSPQTELQEVQTEVNEDSNIIEDEYDTELGGSEEGDFGEEEVQAAQEQTPHKTIQKRTVPSHAKITKQNFQEFEGTRILVAEDNLINQKVLTGLLAGSGIDVVIADDGQEALDILEKDSDFLMILMDAHMPRVDGFEATRIIRQNPDYDHILVVALSGDTAADDIAKMRNAGMAEQLEKPLRMEALYEIFYAYTGSEAEKNPADYIEVVMTKELNGDKGLGICGGDDDFYKEILSEFITTYENSTQKLGNLLKNEQIKEADKLLLDIIGITANIGADPLNKIAQEIKVALSDTEEKSYLTLTDQYKIHLEDLIKDIKNYF